MNKWLTGIIGITAATFLAYAVSKNSGQYFSAPEKYRDLVLDSGKIAYSSSGYQITASASAPGRIFTIVLNEAYNSTSLSVNDDRNLLVVDGKSPSPKDGNIDYIVSQGYTLTRDHGECEWSLPSRFNCVEVLKLASHMQEEYDFLTKVLRKEYLP
ncbi:MAG: hypothetical protein V2A62_02300 [Candidatus Woesearchaeota archaeon]